MQDFVFTETGLADRLQTYVPTHPKLVHFPGLSEPAWIYREPDRLDREFADKWGEHGDVEAFRADEGRVVEFLQRGYREAVPPTIDAAIESLGETLTRLWITGSGVDLLNHYFTSEQAKVYMAMTITESGPVSLSEPYSAFTLPVMDSGSIFDGYYGFVRGGIWQITAELGRINEELGVDIRLNSMVGDIDTGKGEVTFEQDGTEVRTPYDLLLLATDPVTAARLAGSSELVERTGQERVQGSSGKLNLMFRKPVRWKHGSDRPDSDAAFRFLFSVDSLEDFERASLKVTEPGVDYEPGYMQIYCEGGAMRMMDLNEPFDRLAVFFKNFGLNRPGDELRQIEEQARDKVLELVENPEDCAWTRLLTPRDLKDTFLFPGGNLDHTMLVGGQQYFDRQYSADPSNRFYNFGDHENIHICGAGTYPCARSDSDPVGARLVGVAAVCSRLGNTRECADQEVIVVKVAAPQHGLPAIAPLDSDAGIEHADLSGGNGRRDVFNNRDFIIVDVLATDKALG
jgi:phytoene dehydrogenase-like protein